MKPFLTRLLTLGLATVALPVAASLLMPANPAAALPTCVPSGPNTVCTFSFTGAPDTWTVPSGVTQATFVASGAQGGLGGNCTIFTGTPGAGGLGGQATATIAVTPLAVMQVNVGGKGADAGVSSLGGALGGAGGGASDVRTGSYGLGERVIIGGGGGGGGGACST